MSDSNRRNNLGKVVSYLLTNSETQVSSNHYLNYVGLSGQLLKRLFAFYCLISLKRCCREQRANDYSLSFSIDSEYAPLIRNQYSIVISVVALDADKTASTSALNLLILEVISSRIFLMSIPSIRIIVSRSI
jgi:hypothetical protein